MIKYPNLKFERVMTNIAMFFSILKKIKIYHETTANKLQDECHMKDYQFKRVYLEVFLSDGTIKFTSFMIALANIACKRLNITQTDYIFIHKNDKNRKIY